MAATPQLSFLPDKSTSSSQCNVISIEQQHRTEQQHDATKDLLPDAEALAADLKAYQRQLMAVAQEMLVGCNDTTWVVAAPASCSILCTLGESATSTACCEES